MLRKFATGLALASLMASAAFAEVHEVQMLNKGEAGNMVFEPGLLKIAAGDTVKFVATDRSHNAESIEDMVPDGAEAFEGKINEEIEVTFDVEGLYGVRCKPHYAMGMVMIIAVGEANGDPEEFLEGRIPPRAKERFESQLGEL